MPEAPHQTISANSRAKQIVSYNPFIHKCSAPPIRETANKAITPKLHNQKASLIWIGIKVGKINYEITDETGNVLKIPTGVQASPLVL